MEIPITDMVEMSQYRPIPITDLIIGATLLYSALLTINVDHESVQKNDCYLVIGSFTLFLGYTPSTLLYHLAERTERTS